jgi:hypothetical protein
MITNQPQPLLGMAHWTPSPCGRLSRPRTTTGPPPHPAGIGRRCAFPPGSRLLPGMGTGGMVPTFTPEPFDGVGAQLCPCSIATATPQAFTVASRPTTSPSPGVPRPATLLAMPIGCALQSSPDPPCWSCGSLEGRSAAGPHVRLSVSLARPEPSSGTGPSRRCQGCFRSPPRHGIRPARSCR